MNHFLWAGLAVLLSLVGVVGDYCIKIAGRGPRYIVWHWQVIGMLVYALSGIGWFFAIKHSPLQVLGLLYAVSTVVFLALMGHFYFGETLNGVEWAGLIMGVASLTLLARYA